MKKILSLLILTAMLCAALPAFAQDILYTGSVSKNMTIRASKSTSAGKQGSVEVGETIHILDKRTGKRTSRIKPVPKGRKTHGVLCG